MAAKTKVRGATQVIRCACGCRRKKTVRVADIKRGWGKYYSKSCKARHQEARTGQYQDYLERQDERELFIGAIYPEQS